MKRISTLLVVATLASAACTKPQDQTPEPQASLMAEGLKLLYETGDAYGAENLFRQVLAQNPTHFGAHYQLAVALDSGGRPAESRAAWNTMLQMAEQIGDTATIRAARARLAAPDTINSSAMMRRGLHLLYTLNDTTAAVAHYRAMLRKYPTHYGATYQLATALDRAGETAEARTMWVRMLGMAEAARDSATAATARTRLARP